MATLRERWVLPFRSRLKKQQSLSPVRLEKLLTRANPGEGKMMQNVCCCSSWLDHCQWILPTSSTSQWTFSPGSSPQLSFTTRAPKEPSPSLATQIRDESGFSMASGEKSLAHPIGKIAETRCRFSLEGGNGSAKGQHGMTEVPEARENLSCCLSMCPSNVEDWEKCHAMSCMHVVKLLGGPWPVEIVATKSHDRSTFGSSFFYSWDVWQDIWEGWYKSIPRPVLANSGGSGWMAGEGSGEPGLSRCFHDFLDLLGNVEMLMVDQLIMLTERWSTPASPPSSDLQDRGPADSNAGIDLPSQSSQCKPTCGWPISGGALQIMYCVPRHDFDRLGVLCSLRKVYFAVSDWFYHVMMTQCKIWAESVTKSNFNFRALRQIGVLEFQQLVIVFLSIVNVGAYQVNYLIMI